MNAGVWLGVAMTLGVLGCDRATQDCAVPQAARQRFVRAGEDCDAEASPRTLGYAWDGYACGPILTGDCLHAGCEGSACGSLYGSRSGCRRAYAGCEGTCAARLTSVRDELPTHPVCRADPNLRDERPAVEYEECRRDEDCREGVNGSCELQAWDLVRSLVCRYDECFTDADCAAGAVCSPLYEADLAERAQSHLYCVRATCSTSADCEEGAACEFQRASPASGAFTPSAGDFLYVCGAARCSTSTPVAHYLVSTLEIPTPEDVLAGTALGQNVDGVGDDCDVSDYADGIDNALLELHAGLTTLGADPVLDLQRELDAALACPEPSSECEPLGLSFATQTCLGATVIRVHDGAGVTLAGPVALPLADVGPFRVTFPALALSLPVRTPSGVARLPLALSNVIISGTLTSTGLEGMVLGGSVLGEELGASLAALLPQLSGGPTSEELAGLLAALLDVRLEGECRGHSVGLRLEAARVTSAAP